jgi:type VI secretion system protein ImpK
MPGAPPQTQNLASCYENALTIILRLSSLQRGSATNSQDFRTSIRAALKAAMEQAKSLGYSSEVNQLAFFAVVALLDESVLKMQDPAFSDWAQRPLQEEMFGHNRAGEVFFDHLRTLLSRQDSAETADCLEVYCLCMLLGFKGKYALGPSRTYVSGASRRLIAFADKRDSCPTRRSCPSSRTRPSMAGVAALRLLPPFLP